RAERDLGALDDSEVADGQMREHAADCRCGIAVVESSGRAGKSKWIPGSLAGKAGEVPGMTKWLFRVSRFPVPPPESRFPSPESRAIAIRRRYSY
ncbi:MAG: hypothetical protein ACREPJ_01460, partial [Rhodanobacteraceae bacterium]